MQRPFLVHAITPLHAGTGHSADLIDLPIARMKASNIPYVPGSSIKGVLRSLAPKSHAKEIVEAAFGPDTDHAGDFAGALVVGDARLLAMPVRSMLGTFAWVSSPLLLHLAARDLGRTLALPSFKPGERGAQFSGECVCLHDKKIFLEDLDLDAKPEKQAIAPWVSLLAKLVYPDAPALFERRFVVVDDETMSFLLETATQVDARVRIDEHGTVADGALWLEESLPAETLLIGVLNAERSRDGKDREPKEMLDVALPHATRDVQLGGKASIGRGRCRLVEVPA